MNPSGNQLFAGAGFAFLATMSGISSSSSIRAANAQPRSYNSRNRSVRLEFVMMQCCSGPRADLVMTLSNYGLDIRVVNDQIGAASALKMSYAGLTKGLIAVGAAMVGGVSRAGLASELRAELERSQPELLAMLRMRMPAMFSKAYRWVAEMEQMGNFLAMRLTALKSSPAQLASTSRLPLSGRKARKRAHRSPRSAHSLENSAAASNGSRGHFLTRAASRKVNELGDAASAGNRIVHASSGEASRDRAYVSLCTLSGVKLCGLFGVLSASTTSHQWHSTKKLVKKCSGSNLPTRCSNLGFAFLTLLFQLAAQTVRRSYAMF